MLAKPVPAGTPVRADELSEERIDLDEHLIKDRDATFLVRVQGDSMTGFGVHDGDLLVVERPGPAIDRSVVIVVVDGEFTVKQFCRLPDGILLRAGSTQHSDIFVNADQSCEVWGVVRWSIHEVDNCHAGGR